MDDAIKHMLAAYQSLQKACITLQGDEFNKTYGLVQDLEQVISDLMAVVKAASDQENND